MKLETNKPCNMCRASMKPLYGGTAYKCKCGNAYLHGQGYVRLQPGEDIFIRDGRVHGKYVFYPEIRKAAEPDPKEPEELIMYIQPTEWTSSGPYRRNANELLKGGIYYVAFHAKYEGSEIKKNRPCVIVSNVQQTEYTSQVTVIPLTTRIRPEKKSHVSMSSTGTSSTALIEQITTVDVKRVGTFMGTATVDEMMRIKIAMQRYLDFSVKQGADNERYAALEAENYALKTQLQEMMDEVNQLRRAQIRWEEEKCILQKKQ